MPRSRQPAEDRPLARAMRLVETADRDAAAVTGFLHEATNSMSYVVVDRASREAAVIDPVLDFDPLTGRTGDKAASEILRFIEAERLSVRWILETHIHADHLSAASWLRKRTGGMIGAGARIRELIAELGPLFGLSSDTANRFDRFFADGEAFMLGRTESIVLHIPGHTPADAAYLIGDSVFVGDTLFMPDYGTARTDFPGGSARTLYRSIRRLLSLPPPTPLFLCHDYGTGDRQQLCFRTDVGATRARNIHVADGISEDAFVEMRDKRDASLAMPRLFLAAIQVNLAAGELPPPDEAGRRFLKIPLDVF